LKLEELRELINLGDANLSLEAVRVAASNPVVGSSLLLDVVDDSAHEVQLRAEAVAGLSPIVSQHIGKYLEWSRSTDEPIRSAALTALRDIPLNDRWQKQLTGIADRYPDSTHLVHAISLQGEVPKGRPARTDTEAWTRRLAELPGKGDAEKGARLFHYAGHAACARCHRQDGRGSVVGPDLSRPRKDPKWLLESILQPSAEMAPEYRPRAIVLHDGRTFTGIRLRSSTSEVIRDANGQNLSFPRDQIESMHELDTSFMPDGIVDRLTDRELRDLLAFLME
jgi:putative heme-binding domain-containing protein